MSLITTIQNFIKAINSRSGKYGESYGPGFFTNRCKYSGIFRESRKVVMRLIRSPCIICGEPLSYNSEGDHVIPVSKGGRDNISNFIPLCKRHNASKGNRDLMKWGIQKQFIDRFSPDVLCTYARGSDKPHYHFPALPEYTRILASVCEETRTIRFSIFSVSVIVCPDEILDCIDRTEAFVIG